MKDNLYLVFSDDNVVQSWCNAAIEDVSAVEDAGTRHIVAVDRIQQFLTMFCSEEVNVNFLNHLCLVCQCPAQFKILGPLVQ